MDKEDKSESKPVEQTDKSETEPVLDRLPNVFDFPDEGVGGDELDV